MNSPLVTRTSEASRFCASLCCLLFLLALGGTDAKGGDQPLPLSAESLAERCRLLFTPSPADLDLPGRLMDGYLAEVESSPQSPSAVLALHLLSRLPLADLAWQKSWGARMKVLAGRFDLSLDARLLVMDLLAQMERRQGSFAEALRLDEECGRIAQWQLAGPFGRWGMADFGIAFPPEGDGAAGKHLRRGAKDEPVAWLKVQPSPFDGLIRPGAYIPSEADVIVYLRSRIEVEREIFGQLSVDIKGSWALWLNGKKIWVQNRLSSYHPRVTRFPVTLKAGGSEILFKLYSPDVQQHFRICLFSADGRRIMFQETGHAGPFEASVQASVTNQPLAPAPSATLTAFLNAVRELPDNPSLLGALACLYRDMDQPDLALASVRRAAEAKGPLAVSLLAAEIAGEAYHLPPEVRLIEARRRYRAALDSTPDCTKALLALAAMERDDEQPAEALALLSRARKLSPENLGILRRMIDIALAEGWTAEALRWREEMKAVKGSQDTLSYVLTSAKVDSHQKRAKEAIASYARAVELDAGQFRFWEALVKGRAQVNDRAGALAVAARLAELAPADPGAVLLRADLAAVLDSPREELALVEQACTLLPYDASLWLRLGEISLRQREHPRALEAYARSLKLAPSQHRLRQFVATLRGEAYEFWQAYAHSPAAAMKTAEKAEHFGSTVRLIDQSVLEIYADGSRAEVIHQLQKVLSKGGIQEASRVPIHGDLLEARTLLPGGQIREPIRLEGQPAFTMPYLYPGGAIEYRFLARYPERKRTPLHCPSFFFRSPDTYETFVLSDYVVRVEEGFPFSYVQKNFTGPPVILREEGFTVYRWTLTDMPRVQKEALSAHITEFLPYVDIGERASWEEIGRLLAREVEGALRPTVELKACLDSLLAETPVTRKNMEDAPEPSERPVLPQSLAQPLSDEETVARIFHFCLDKIEHQPNGLPASGILARRSGDRSILLLALLTMAGIDARHAALRPSVEWLPKPNWELPDLAYLTERAVVVFLPGREEALWLDTRFRYTRMGEIFEHWRGATALVAGDGGEVFITLPSPALSRYERATRLTVRLKAGERTAALERRVTYRGLEGAERKETMNSLADRDRLKRVEEELGTVLSGFTGTVLTVKGLSDRTQPLQEVVTCAGESLLRGAGTGFYSLPLCLSPLRLYSEMEENALERETPCRLTDFLVGSDEVLIELPLGYSAVDLPPEVALKDSFGSYRLTISAELAGVRIRRHYSFTPQFIAVADFPQFLDLARQVARADRLRITLRHETEAPQ